MATENTERNVLIWIGVSVIVLTFIYFFSVTFVTIPAKNERYGDLILGYVSGLVSAIIGYYWGGSNHKAPASISFPPDNKTISETTTTTKSVPKEESIDETVDSDEDVEEEDDMTPPVKG